jgi:pimeloyl-ACP methyl ester carboxylesterase
MDKARINDVDIAFDVRGEGEPVLLIHGAMIADAMRPLAEGLSGRQTIVYHRRGYGESTGGPSDVPTHAADARALLEHLSITSAHVVGHSYGGSTALQLAADAPAAIASLSLLEPGIVGQIPSAELLGPVMAPIIETFSGGDAEGATRMFANFVMGPQAEAWAAKNVGADAFKQAVADALSTFGGDLTSLGEWSFGADDAARITCPVLVILGLASEATVQDAIRELGGEVPDIDLFGEMVGVVQQWIPQAEIVKLEGINHALQIQDPAKLTRAVGTFIAAHKLVPA